MSFCLARRQQIRVWKTTKGAEKKMGRKENGGEAKEIAEKESEEAKGNKDWRTNSGHLWF